MEWRCLQAKEHLKRQPQEEKMQWQIQGSRGFQNDENRGIWDPSEVPKRDILMDSKTGLIEVLEIPDS